MYSNICANCVAFNKMESDLIGDEISIETLIGFIVKFYLNDINMITKVTRIYFASIKRIHRSNKTPQNWPYNPTSMPMVFETKHLIM